MISEVDIRDWESIRLREAKEELAILQEDKGADEHSQVAIAFLQSFIDSVEAIHRKQVAQIPALFKPPLFSNWNDVEHWQYHG